MTKPQAGKQELVAPKKPLTSFMLWSNVSRPALNKEFPGIKFLEVSRVLGERWAELDPAEKTKWHLQADEDKKRFVKEQDAFVKAGGVLEVKKPGKKASVTKKAADVGKKLEPEEDQETDAEEMPELPARKEDQETDAEEEEAEARADEAEEPTPAPAVAKKQASGLPQKPRPLVSTKQTPKQSKPLLAQKQAPTKAAVVPTGKPQQPLTKKANPSATQPAAAGATGAKKPAPKMVAVKKVEVTKTEVTTTEVKKTQINKKVKPKHKAPTKESDSSDMDEDEHPAEEEEEEAEARADEAGEDATEDAMDEDDEGGEQPKKSKSKSPPIKPAAKSVAKPSKAVSAKPAVTKSKKVESGAVEKAKKSTKQPGEPKKVITLFLAFVKAERAKVVSENPGATFVEIGKLMGEKWKAMSEDGKSLYAKAVEEDKKRYEREMKMFKELHRED